MSDHQSDFQGQVTDSMGKLEKALVPLFAKMPHLPEDIRRTLVGFAPWIALLAGILGMYLYMIVGIFGVLFAPFILLSSGLLSIFFFGALLFGTIGAVLDLLAFGPLKRGQKKGWNYIFYGSVLSAITVILRLFTRDDNITSLLFMFVGFYLLFEIRSHYKH